MPIIAAFIALLQLLSSFNDNSDEHLAAARNFRGRALAAEQSNQPTKAIELYQKAIDEYFLAQQSNSGIDTKLLDQTRSRIASIKETMNSQPSVTFKDVIGLDAAKQVLFEAIVLPQKLPHLYKTGTIPWKGILFYGPPGTGKSILAEATAGEIPNATLFSVSVADLVSQKFGESEQKIRTLFEKARMNKPSIIFIDEIESLISDRGQGHSEESQRMISEFLCQLDGVGVDNSNVLFIGATNIPWRIDSAMRRRFEKRIYLPLPSSDLRKDLIKKKLKGHRHVIEEDGFSRIALQTHGFSGADLIRLVNDALMGPVRSVMTATSFTRGTAFDKYGNEQTSVWIACENNEYHCVPARWNELKSDEIGLTAVSERHFEASLQTVKASISKAELQPYEDWTNQFGESGM
jgi:vacuolar protein-sorting-associated protein 4